MLYRRTRDASDGHIPRAAFALVFAGLFKVTSQALKSEVGRDNASQVGAVLRPELQTPITAVSLRSRYTRSSDFLTRLDLPVGRSFSSELVPNHRHRSSSCSTGRTLPPGDPPGTPRPGHSVPTPPYSLSVHYRPSAHACASRCTPRPTCTRSPDLELYEELDGPDRCGRKHRVWI